MAGSSRAVETRKQSIRDLIARNPHHTTEELVSLAKAKGIAGVTLRAIGMIRYHMGLRGGQPAHGEPVSRLSANGIHDKHSNRGTENLRHAEEVPPVSVGANEENPSINANDLYSLGRIARNVGGWKRLTRLVIAMTHGDEVK